MYDSAALVRAYANSTADFVGHMLTRKPFWWDVQQRFKARPGGADFSRFVGDPAHGLPEGTFNFANLACFRGAAGARCFG